MTKTICETSRVKVAQTLIQIVIEGSRQQYASIVLGVEFGSLAFGTPPLIYIIREP